MKTYLFYDLETSGLNETFDQILQFAAIRTDENLNELERVEYFFQLRPDVLPSPQALLVNQISLEKIENGILEYDGITKIFQLFNQPETVSIGYNNLGFDDEFLRFNFYRNLLPPYQHQYLNQCFRMDLYLITIFNYLYFPNKINWLKNEPLKLENLVIANQLFASKPSHDAMGDVEATVTLAKLLKKDGQTWKYLEENFCKNIEKKRLDKHLTKTPLAWLIGGFGYTLNFKRPAYYLGIHRHYQNQQLWLPLDKPLENDPSIPNLFPLRKKLGEPPFILPLTPKYGNLSEVVYQNLNWIKNNEAWFTEMKNYHLEEKYPVVDNLTAEASLYQSKFWTDFELKTLEFFHQCSPDKKLYALENSSASIKELGLYILFRNFPQALNNLNLEQRKHYLHEIWHTNLTRYNYRNAGYLTLEQWLENFNALSSQEQRELEPFKNWIIKQQKQFS